jgi:hypothetical protein
MREITDYTEYEGWAIISWRGNWWLILYGNKGEWISSTGMSGGMNENR